MPRVDRKIVREQYRIRTTDSAKEVGREFLQSINLENVVVFGLPEIDDRFNIWRVPLKSKLGDKVGEVVIDAITTLIDWNKSTSKEILENRLLGRNNFVLTPETYKKAPKLSRLRNTIGLGDSEELLRELPAESVDLIFTSPPYFNAKPEYAEYLSYEDYLLKMRKIIHECKRVLNEGRFFVINVSPVLIRRASRSEASRRIAVPFDFHRLFTQYPF